MSVEAGLAGGADGFGIMPRCEYVGPLSSSLPSRSPRLINEDAVNDPAEDFGVVAGGMGNDAVS